MNNAPGDHVTKMVLENTDKLQELAKLVADFRASKEMCDDLLKRLQPIQAQLAEMQRSGSKEYHYVLIKYNRVVKDFLYFLKEHEQCHVVKRVARHWKMKMRISKLHKEVDTIAKLIDQDQHEEKSQAERQARLDAQHQQEVAQLRKIVREERYPNIVREIHRSRSVLLSLTDIDHELKFNRDAYSREELEMMETTFATGKQCTEEEIPDPHKWYISPSDIQFKVNPFAKGEFNSLHYGTLEPGTKVAINFVLPDEKDGQTTREKFINETNLWYNLKHPHILQLYGACHVGPHLFFVSARAEQGNFNEYLPNNMNHFWRVFRDVALGLAYLHKLNHVHSNLKCNNLLVKKDGAAVISDFWYSFVRTDAALSAKEQVDTCRWKAPECLEVQAATANPRFESDIYSFGMCLYEGMTGELPYGNDYEDSIVSKILAGKLPPRTAKLSDDAWELILKLCARDWRDRLHIDDLLAALDELAKKEEQADEATCQFCSRVNAHGSNFCHNCGKPLRQAN